MDKAPDLHPHDPGSNPGPAILISSNSPHFYFACLYRGYPCSDGFRCACPIGRWVRGSLGGSVVGLGCAWMAYRLWVAGGVALCPSAFRCAHPLVARWVKLVFSCFSGSRCVQLSPTEVNLDTITPSSYTLVPRKWLNALKKYLYTVLPSFWSLGGFGVVCSDYSVCFLSW